VNEGRKGREGKTLQGIREEPKVESGEKMKGNRGRK
jgi:hypothetical protein